MPRNNSIQSMAAGTGDLKHLKVAHGSLEKEQLLITTERSPWLS